MTTEISAKTIAELRKRTGVGIDKCKKALEEAGGDIEAAIEHLRKTGLASAVKKADRETKEGKIEFFETPEAVACVTINSETDFVAKNEEFLSFAKEVAKVAAEKKLASLEALLQAPADTAPTVEDLRIAMVQKIGENIQIKKVDLFLKTPTLSIGVYSHGGKVVTVVQIEGSPNVQDLAKDVAMHVAAAMPEYLLPENVPQELIEKETDVAAAQIAGKPDHVKEKILEGKIAAFCNAICLVKQQFIKDDSLSIEALLEKHSKEAGSPLKIVAFERLTVS